MQNNELAVKNHFDRNMLNMGPLASTDIICTSTWDAGCGLRPFVVQILCLINVIQNVKANSNRECS